MECPVLGEREKERQKETERDRERERRETRSGVILCAGRFDEGYIYARDQGFYNYRVQPAWGIGGGWTLVEVVRLNLSNSFGPKQLLYNVAPMFAVWHTKVSASIDGKLLT